MRNLYIGLVIAVAFLLPVAEAYSETTTSSNTDTIQLVPRLQVVGYGKVEYSAPSSQEPWVLDTFPLGTIKGARHVTKDGNPFWVFPVYRFGLNTVAPRTIELCLTFDETKSVNGIGTLGYGDIMMMREAEKLSCTLSESEGVYCVADYVSPTDVNAQFWPAGTLLSWKFLIFWEEE